MKVTLYNGAKSKNAWNEDSPEFIDDCKPERTELQADFVQVTYGDHIKIGTRGHRLELFWHDGFIHHDGIFYGDFLVE